MVRVLDEDPDLASRLSGDAVRLARAAAVAPLLVLDVGVHDLTGDVAGADVQFGLLVLDGLIARHVTFGQIGSTEFIGPGDVFGRSALSEVEALSPTRLAVLDEDFATRTRAWPAIPAALLERANERSDAQILQAALHQARRVEDRVLVALWHFARRWGQETAEGRVVRLPNVTGDALARFIGARRQSVSTAFGVLADRGALRRLSDDRLLLPAEPPELAGRPTAPPPAATR